MGSAWLTTTMVRLRWRVASFSSVTQIRCCISENDSPSGKRKVLGECCTAFHSALRCSRPSFLPVQVPKSHSSSPRSVTARRPRDLAMGAAVSRARSSGET